MIVKKIGDSMITPLGFSVEENFAAVMAGRSEMRRYESLWNLPFPCFVSLIPDEKLEAELAREMSAADVASLNTKFEKITLLSAVKAVKQSGIDPKSERVVFVLSSTKGNVELLADEHPDLERVTPAHTAQLVVRYFQNLNMPITVSNACISGLCAQIEAFRCLKSGQYDTAVVIGADVLSPFIVSPASPVVGIPGD